MLRHVITVTRLKRVNLWIGVGVLVYRGDSLGEDEDGRAHVVDRDVVVTGLVPEPWGVLLAYRGVAVRPEGGPAA